jgi:hypothetical protein
MTYTQVKIKQEYREKLAKLASSHNRSMANMVEVLIDAALAQSTLTGKEK